MGYDNQTKQITRDYRFETAEDAENGDHITQQQMDVAFDGVVENVNALALDLFGGIDAFNAVFLGAHVSDPTVDGDGNPVVSGAIYVNTTVPELRFYNGTTWVPAAQSSVIVDNFIGDASRLSFALGIPPRSEKTLFVHIDGVYQNKDTFSISGNSIVFSEAPPLGAIIETMLFSTTSIGQTSAELVQNARGGTVQGFIDGLPSITFSSGSPEGVVTALVGSIYTRTDGGVGTTLYVKESGAGNTGWAAK